MWSADVEARWRELSEEVITGMAEWRGGDPPGAPGGKEKGPGGGPAARPARPRRGQAPGPAALRARGAHAGLLYPRAGVHGGGAAADRAGGGGLRGGADGPGGGARAHAARAPAGARGAVAQRGRRDGAARAGGVGRSQDLGPRSRAGARGQQARGAGGPYDRPLLLLAVGGP